MKKIVISGSSKLQDKVEFWVKHLEKQYQILDYPKLVNKDNYFEELPNVYKKFYTNLETTDIYFLMNEEKNGINGYIGANSFAELTYVVILNLIHNKNIEIFILNMPSIEVNSYAEVKLWLDMGWIKLYEKNE